MPALLTATDCTGHVHLIVGYNPLASSRVHRSLELGAKVKLLAPADAQLHYNLQQKVDDGTIEWLQKENVTREDLLTQGRTEVEGAIDAVFVTLPVVCAQCTQISNLCKRLRIPVNVADAPTLCTFTLLSTHTDGPLQIGVTTSGRGCKLASRIRREIATSLPADLGAAVDRLGRLRRAIWNEDNKDESQPHSQYQKDGADSAIELMDEDEDSGQDANFNRLITPEDFEAVKTRRVRWLSQMCEYWPLSRLCALTEPELDSLLRDYTSEKDGYFSGLTHSIPSSDVPIIESDLQSTDGPTTISNHTPLTHPSFISPLSPSRGIIHLLGSGPGDPALLTTAALTAINRATLILADKLVPASVLDLIPRRTPIHIARKFPGNADRAQEELQSMALAALQRGESVVRLKQGDPFLFGRGAEEVEFFKEHGYDAIVVPGITSALSAPLFAGIPVTHRGVSDQVLVATGTGRKGAAPDPPEYKKNQTVVFLMALHRLTDLVDSLCVGKSWPKNVPCAVIERASCADQRVVRATLGSVVAAIEEVGSRPPGLIVVGWVCEVGLKESEKADIQKGQWKVEEGFKGY